MIHSLNTLYRSRVLRYSLLAIGGLIVAFGLLIMTWGLRFLKQPIEHFSA